MNKNEITGISQVKPCGIKNTDGYCNGHCETCEDAKKFGAQLVKNKKTIAEIQAIKNK